MTRIKRFTPVQRVFHLLLMLSFSHSSSYRPGSNVLRDRLGSFSGVSFRRL